MRLRQTSGRGRVDESVKELRDELPARLHFASHHSVFQKHQARVVGLQDVDEGLEFGMVAAKSREPHAVLSVVVVVQRLIHAGKCSVVDRASGLRLLQHGRESGAEHGVHLPGKRDERGGK